MQSKELTLDISRGSVEVIYETANSNRVAGYLTGERIGVVGATGFIGHNLCAALKTRGAYVRAIGRRPVNGSWDEFIRADLMQGVPASALYDVDTVFHLAGRAHALSETKQDEGEYFDVNVEGTRRLLEVAKEAGVRRFIFFSSVKAMGEGGDTCLNEQIVCDPETPYGQSKLEAERLVLEGRYVPEPVVLRLSMVYGLTCKGNLPRMIEAIRKGRFPPLPEMNNRRSMVHVDDVVRAAILVVEKAEAVNKTYIVTDGEAYSTRQMYEWICDALHKPIPGWSVPLSVLNVLARVGDMIGATRGRRFMFDSDALEKLTGSACYSSAKIQHELGFKAQHTLRESIPVIVQYLCK